MLALCEALTLVHAKTRGGGVSQRARTAIQIPRRTFYNWWNRYREYGLEGLRPRFKGPHGVDRTAPNITKPREILTDHGSQFSGALRGKSNFNTYFQQRKVRNILDGIGKPSTLGKIERLFRTCDQESALFPVPRKFTQYHSYERPHIALDYPTAAEVHFHNVPKVIG
jgi:transposase InsO family protein